MYAIKQSKVLSQETILNIIQKITKAPNKNIHTVWQDTTILTANDLEMFEIVLHWNTLNIFNSIDN